MFGSFSAKFMPGKAPVKSMVDPKVTVTTPGASTPTYGSGAATWVSSTDNALVNAGYTLGFVGTADDQYFSISIPFTFYIYGVGGTVLYPCSNTYITLTSGRTDYRNLKLSAPAIPNVPTLHLGSADNSWQRVWYKNNITNITLRYEGNSSTSGGGGSPGIVYEATFYPSDGTYQYIQINIGTHGRTSGVFGLSNGTGSTYLNFGTVTPNTNYVLRTDAVGNNPVFYTGTYTP